MYSRIDPRWAGGYSGLKLGIRALACSILLLWGTAWGGDAAGDAIDQLPASYEGELPGAGGPILWHLDLLPAGCYQLRLVYSNRPEPNRFDSIGRWLCEGSGRIVLRGDRETPVFLMPVAGGKALRKLDLGGNPVATSHNDRLVRLPAPALIEPHFVMTGLFTNAGVAAITLCANGQQLPVAREGDYSSLETAFNQVNARPEQPRRVSLEGVITQRPVTGERGVEQACLLVERFIAVSPYDTCEDFAGGFPLRGTSWKLIGLGDQPVAAVEKQRQAHLVFAVDELRVFGSGGCNRIIGSVALNGDRLRFDHMGTTMMACPDGMDLERRFLEALGNVVCYRLSGRRLELLDGQGVVVARFAAETPE